MTITNRAARLSLSTDQTAVALRGIHSPADASARRRDEAVRGAAPLDLNALYPDLFADQRPAAPTAVSVAVRHIADLFSAFRGAPAPVNQ